MKHLLESFVGNIGYRQSHGNLSRLEKYLALRMRELNLSTIDEFRRYVGGDDPCHARERQVLAEVLTSRETYFMRDRGQMELLRNRILPELIQRRRESRLHYLRLWSCACSTGEEPYSLAILLGELLPDIESWDIRIVGSDINIPALRRAEHGVYGPWSLRDCSMEFVTKNFQPDAKDWVLRQDIKARVTFLQNDVISDPLPDAGRDLINFDLIVCRNLFIYLEQNVIGKVAQKLADCLAGGGYLLTGHGELIKGRPEILQTVMHEESLIFRKQAGQGFHCTENRSEELIGTNIPIKTGRTKKNDIQSIGRGKRLQVRNQAVHSSQRTYLENNEGIKSLPTIESVWQLANDGQLQTAETLCKQLLQNDSMNTDYHFLMALIQDEQSHYSISAQSMRRALYLDPDIIKRYPAAGFWRKPGGTGIQRPETVCGTEPEGGRSAQNTKNSSWLIDPAPLLR